LRPDGLHHQAVDAGQVAAVTQGRTSDKLLAAVDQEARQVRYVHVEGDEK
jgi:ribosomal protein L14E/L6E/L27E